MVQIIVHYNGNMNVYDVDGSMTTKQLREMVAAQEGKSANDIKIVYSSFVFKEDNEEKTLENYHIDEGALLYALPRFVGGL